MLGRLEWPRVQFMASKEKHNARWDRCITKNLLEICVKEIRISGKPGVSFKARRWEVVVDEFNKRLGWNHETVTIVADDTWWEAKIKDNSKYASFRYQGLEFCEKLEIIFGETVATSQRSWTPATGAPSEDSSIKTNPTIPEEIDEYDEEETNLDEDASHMVNNQLKRKKIASEAMTESHNAAEAVEMSQTSGMNGHFSIPDGIKILRNLKDEGKLDVIQYFYAVDLLRVQQERIIIMSLSESIDELVGWILYKYELDKKSSD
ncbi:hypothetical protein K1719_018110 [Acacia pycnantha]|nr:hypothetical protein K1719_018110 [Acacia pycnantha]